MVANFLFTKKIKSLCTQNERKAKKRARRNTILVTDTILSVQEGQDRFQQSDIRFNGQVDKPRPRPRKRALQCRSGCGTIGHTVRSCPSK